MSDHDYDHGQPIAIPLDQLKTEAAALAAALKNLGATAALAASGGGSLHRGLPADLQSRFIKIRAALFQRGIYDPVLVRFDTASVTQASTQEIAEQLETVAGAL